MMYPPFAFAQGAGAIRFRGFEKKRASRVPWPKSAFIG
jgi:hypothetical protein